MASDYHVGKYNSSSSSGRFMFLFILLGSKTYTYIKSSLMYISNVS